MPKKPPGPPPRTAFPRGGRPPEKFAPRAKYDDKSKMGKPSAPFIPRQGAAGERPIIKKKTRIGKPR